MDKEEGWHVWVDNGVCHTTQVESELCIIAPHSTGGAGGGGVGLLKNWGNLKFWMNKEGLGSLQLEGTGRAEQDEMNGT